MSPPQQEESGIFTPVGKYRIRNVHSRLYLNENQEGNIIQDREGAIFTLLRDTGDNRILQIKFTDQNRVLDVAASGGNGTKVLAYTNYCTANQKWLYVQPTQQLVPLHNKKLALDVPASSTKPGTELIVWAQHDSGNQKWILDVVDEKD